MKSKHIAACLLVSVFAIVGCATVTPTEGVLLADASVIAKTAGTAAATYYGGPAAGALASDGLSALGAVLQSYVNAKIPRSVVVATPGVANVGAAILPLIDTSAKVTQADVNAVNQAAAIVATSGKP